MAALSNYLENKLLDHALATIAESGEIDTTGLRDPRELAGDFDAAVSDEAPALYGLSALRELLRGSRCVRLTLGSDALGPGGRVLAQEGRLALQQ